MKVINTQATLAVPGGNSTDYQFVVGTAVASGALIGIIRGMELGGHTLCGVLVSGFGLGCAGLVAGYVIGEGIYTLQNIRS